MSEVGQTYPGSSQPAVDQLDLDVADGEFLVLVGPSGCGKSTSLRMLAGLEEVDAGEIRLGDRDVTTLPPTDRDVAMVFQNYALYRHMTVAENMGFALKIAGRKKGDIAARVRDGAKLLDLEEYLDRKPKALSGSSVSGSRWVVRSFANRRCFSWTSRCRIWMPSFVCRHVLRSHRCNGAWGPQPSTSRTTRLKQ